MFIADLHIHSYLSRATARNLNLEHLSLWAQLKGIRVVGTGDFTHPQWFSELNERLEEAEPGLFRLRPEFSAAVERDVPPSCRAQVRFMLSTEISCIYKRKGATRKNHHVVFVPSFEAADQLNRMLGRVGNIKSDGRPILGLDARDLLEIVLEVSPHAYLVPAHIWTPWFSLFGSKSGFDHLEECFGDLSPHIFALETGLSSDPPMNWRLSALDERVLISNSDAHSPANLGREANVFETDLSYFSVFETLRSRDLQRFLGTIEFFPQEGKYHYDGHRKCQMRMSPKETLEAKGLCPKCGRPVTVGVMHRVEELADRESGVQPAGAAPFRSLMTLPDVLAQTRGVAARSRWVHTQYRHLLEQYGPEFTILMGLPLEDLEAKGYTLLAEGLRRIRKGEVQVQAGYDGEFGSIVLFTPEERQRVSGQGSLIPVMSDPIRSGRPRPDGAPSKAEGIRGRKGEQTDRSVPSREQKEQMGPGEGIASVLQGLNLQQRKAICHGTTPLLIVAGPGTGKTLTLTRRIAYLIGSGRATPDEVLAVTFTNKAADEMQERLAVLLGEEDRVTVRTFHGLGYDMLKQHWRSPQRSRETRILHEVEAENLLAEALAESRGPLRRDERSALLKEISRAKQDLKTPETFDTSDPVFGSAYRRYQEALESVGAVDLDDLIVLPVRFLEDNPDVLDQYRRRFRFLLVDEYQDINYAQYRMVQLLSPKGKNLSVIGDPDQAIYGFRGADSRYFLRFRDDFPEAEVIYLQRNYRSAETILKASASLLGQGPHHLETPLWSGISGDEFLSVGDYPTERAEAESIVHTIEQLVGGTSHFSLDSGRVDGTGDRASRTFSEFAVFYRLHFQGERLAEAFERSGIPFRRIGGEALASHKGVRQVLQALKERADKSRTVGEAVERAVLSLGLDPKEEILEVFLREADAWDGNLEEFLARMALRLDLDAWDPRAERVTLMTLHASKGLEFPVVFIAGCEDNILPYRPQGRTPPPLEEERRLFYVGLTRAKEKVFLTHARKRTLFGRTVVQTPSPFLGEIEDFLKELAASFHRRSVRRKREQLQLF